MSMRIGRSGAARRSDRSRDGLELLEPRTLLSSVGLAAWGVTTHASDAPAYVEPWLGWDGVDTTASDVFLAGASAHSLIGLDRFRADSRFAGINGAGSTVVVLDTGADLNHSWFGPDANGDGVSDSILYHHDFANNDTNASDVNGHGSNVASIIASRNGSFPGVAPGVNLVILKVFRNDNGGSFSYIEQALQWVVANADAYNVVAVNMSLSDQVNHTAVRQLYGVSDELQALANMGVINVSAAGNQYYAYGGFQGVGYPAIDPNVISVGAVYDRDEGGPRTYAGSSVAYTTGPDRLTPFSQRHETLLDILAPGGATTGANTSGGTNAIAGTSQATPHITGVAVLLQQLAEQALGRRLAIGEMVDLIRDTADLVYDGDDEDDNVPNTNAWYRRMNVFAAAEALLAMAHVDSAPTFSTLSTIAGGQQGAPLTIHYSQVLAASNAADADGDAIVFRFNAALSGTITKNGVDITATGGHLAAGESIVWTPGEGVYGVTTAVKLIAWANGVFSGSFVPMRVDVNAAPTLGSIDPLAGARPSQPITITFDDIASDAADAYGGTLAYTIGAIHSGTLTLNGFTAMTGMLFGAGDTLVWTPGDDAAGLTQAFDLRAFDGVLSSAPATVRVGVNGRPNFQALGVFDAIAGSPWTLPFTTLLGEALVIDPEGDAVVFVVSGLLAAGITDAQGNPLQVGDLVGPDHSIHWTPGAGQQGVVSLLTVQAWDGGSRSLQEWTLRVDIQPASGGGDSGGGSGGGDSGGGSGDGSGGGSDGSGGGSGGNSGDGSGGGSDGGTPQLPGGSTETVVGTGSDSGGTWLLRRDAEGSVTLFEREGTFWRRADLTALAGGEVSENVEIWVDAFTGRLNVALVTANEGLILLERDGTLRWTARAMSGLVPGAGAITTNLVRLTAQDGRVTLAGQTASGELVLFQQGATDATGAAAWRYASVTGDLAANGASMPALSGRLIGFVTAWNAHNIAGLNEAGEVIAFWWSPGRERWAMTNLSANTGAPALSGGLTAYLTPWGGINIGGVDAEGRLVFTWWVPSFGAQWRTTDLTTAVGGPRLTDAGVSAFVTPWGALNVAGFRSDGSMVVYWWAPGRAAWSVAAIGEQMSGAPSIATAVTGISQRSGEITVAGLSDSGELVRYWWRPGAAWSYEVLDLQAIDLGSADAA